MKVNIEHPIEKQQSISKTNAQWPILHRKEVLRKQKKMKKTMDDFFFKKSLAKLAYLSLLYKFRSRTFSQP